MFKCKNCNIEIDLTTGKCPKCGTQCFKTSGNSHIVKNNVNGSISIFFSF
ncbi:unnamed protein product [marine sediment metagenome]|uniref:Uncharacterized protein n=1 Tax=marine sediment metagenome TaxID=412755 RepID=X1L816_9ZZZZ